MSGIANLPATARSVARSSWMDILDARAVVTLIALIGAALRFSALGAKPLQFDDAGMWLIARSGGFGTVLLANGKHNSAPPLFAVLIACHRRLQQL